MIAVIKSGGYKISALDIEREILGLDYVAEAVVVGVEDAEYGQKVAAAIMLRKEVRSKGALNFNHLNEQQALEQSLTINRLRQDLRSRLASYKMPSLMRILTEFPRTASGKVVKKTVQTELFPLKGHPDIQVYSFACATKL